MSTEERKAQGRAYAARKLEEKLAAMTPERRAKYEEHKAAHGPSMAKARAARAAKVAAKNSQDKPNQDTMPITATIPITPITAPAPSDSPAIIGAIAHNNGTGTNGKPARLSPLTAEERKNLASAVAIKLRTQGFRHAPTEDRVGRAFLLDALRAAQYETFERERRRHIAQVDSMGEKFFRDLEIELTAKVENEALVKKIEADTIANQPTPIPTAVAAQVAHTMTDEEIITAGLAKASLVQLTQAAMARIFETLGRYESKMNGLADFDNALVDELDLLKRQMGAMQVEITNLRGTAKIKLPVVAIVGCMPHLYHHIIEGAKATGINCDFRHYEQGSKARPFTADYAIVLHWVGHDWDDQVHNAVPDRSRAKFIGQGGVGMAIKQLKEWFSHE